MVVVKNDVLTHIAILSLHSDIFSKIFRYQFHQKKFRVLFSKAIPKDSILDKDKKKIFTAFDKKIGINAQLLIDEEDKIDLTERGKSKLLIQNLEISKWM